jgi:hypothetical protein
MRNDGMGKPGLRWVNCFWCKKTRLLAIHLGHPDDGNAIAGLRIEFDVLHGQGDQLRAPRHGAIGHREQRFDAQIPIDIAPLEMLESIGNM